MDPTVLIFDTPLEAAIACGDRTLALLDEARRERGRAMLAVSGGSTPKLMFQSMASKPFDWRGIQVFQVDERCVPPDRAESNFRLLRESLLDPIHLPEAQIHRVHGEESASEAAAEYTEDIRRVLGDSPVFDVIQRGMGPDAHTASLFPGEPLIFDRRGIVGVVDASRAGMKNGMRYRITLLPGVLERARHTLCLVTGTDKARALSKVLHGPYDPIHLPSQLASADTVWYVDKLAAGPAV